MQNVNRNGTVYVGIVTIRITLNDTDNVLIAALNEKILVI